MKNKLTDIYYIFSLDEPAMPGFCSFSKMYVGTKEQLLIVAENLERKNDYPDTVKAIRDYFNGKHDATHNIAYHDEKVLTPIKILAEHESTMGYYEWTHLNIWKFPIDMKCDSVKVHQIVFKHKGVIYRYIRAWLENLAYTSTIGTWLPLNDGFWGNASVLNVKNTENGFVFNNLLYIEEKSYKNDSESALQDLLDTTKIEFKKICDEIFADG